MGLLYNSHFPYMETLSKIFLVCLLIEYFLPCCPSTNPSCELLLFLSHPALIIHFINLLNAQKPSMDSPCLSCFMQESCQCFRILHQFDPVLCRNPRKEAFFEPLFVKTDFEFQPSLHPGSVLPSAKPPLSDLN